MTEKSKYVLTVNLQVVVIVLSVLGSLIALQRVGYDFFRTLERNVEQTETLITNSTAQINKMDKLEERVRELEDLFLQERLNTMRKFEEVGKRINEK